MPSCNDRRHSSQSVSTLASSARVCRTPILPHRVGRQAGQLLTGRGRHQAELYLTFTRLTAKFYCPFPQDNPNQPPFRNQDSNSKLVYDSRKASTAAELQRLSQSFFVLEDNANLLDGVNDVDINKEANMEKFGSNWGCSRNCPRLVTISDVLLQSLLGGWEDCCKRSSCAVLPFKEATISY